MKILIQKIHRGIAALFAVFLIFQLNLAYLCAAVSTLSLHVQRFCDHNVVAAKRALRYMRGSLERLITWEPGDVNRDSAEVDPS